MKRLAVAALLVLASWPAVAGAQVTSARRMAMGGVVLGRRMGGEGANVAYRGMPRRTHGLGSVSLPIGVLQTLNDPPALDPRRPDFNAFELVNLLESPPWNATLNKPAAPSSDIAFDISQNSLTMQLGSIGRVFPDGPVRSYGALNGPSLGFSIRRMFVAVAPLAEFENELDLNAPLLGALRDGTPIAAHTSYALHDSARAQAAGAVHVGLALPVWTSGDPLKGGSAVYAGARVKLLRGVAYGEADNLAAYATGDTLFGGEALSLDYAGHWRVAGPDGGGMGYGLDAGTVYAFGRFEMGLAMNDIGTRIAWKVTEIVASRDPSSGSLVRDTTGVRVPYTSTVPSTAIANVAWYGDHWMAAADVRHNLLATTAHAGLERWVGPVALRAGAALDAAHRAQVSGGVGLQFGRIALDVSLATQNRNLLGQRVTEIGAGLEVVH